MKLLIDTCTFLWMVGGGRELPARVRDLCVSPDNEVYLSAISAWEIAVKHAGGRLPLPEAPGRLVPEATDRARDHARIRRGICAPRVEVPASRDPLTYDRQQASAGLVIVTPDRLVTQYPARTMW